MLNQEKIGRFIAQCRKEHLMTQKQLAEKLSISDKAVSKWETGKSMPDNAILLELCQILEINVNELLSGEKLSEDSYHGKAEKNMMNLMEQTEKAKKMNKRTWFAMTIGAVVLLTVLWMTVVLSQGDMIWYIDLPSLLLILALSLVVLLASGMALDFFRALVLCIGKKNDVTGDEIVRSLTACKLVLVSAPVAGTIVTLIGIISMFLHQLDQSILTLNLAVAFLSMLYGLIIDLLVLPVAGRLHAMTK